MIFVWLFVGIVAVVVAFLIPESTMDLWPAFNTAGIVLAVYMLALSVFVLRSPLTPRKRGIAGAAIIVWMLSAASLWNGHQVQSHYQRDLLVTIRSTIGRGILLNQVPEAILPVLEQYHAQGMRKTRTIGRIFRDMYPAAEIGANFRVPQWAADTQQVYLPVRIEDDALEIVAIDNVGRGSDPAFVNTGGYVGRIEERFVLTGKGMRHDIIN